ncbi:MAG: AAA family ATPase [Phycisphaerales bacterium]|nr:AAA family ATPase [Phycisphaerales bacterium]
MKLEAFRDLYRAGHACIRVVTLEEPEAAQVLLDFAHAHNLQAWTWSSVQGLIRREVHQNTPVPETENAAAALAWLRLNLDAPALVLTLDLADHLTDPRVLRALRELAEFFRLGPDAGDATGRKALVMIDHKDEVPDAVGFSSVRLDLPAPDDDELESIIRRVISRLRRASPVNASMTRADLRLIIENLRGLSRRHAEQLVAQVSLADGAFSLDDLPAIQAGKRRLLQDAGVLEFVDAPASLDDIGGLDRFKAWLLERAHAFSDQARTYNLPPPRGVLLLGVQGAGKSLAARAVATAWKRPLMRLDPGALYDRYIGESESRLRAALRQAQAMAPVVLWIDEIEKGFAGAAGQSVDGGLSRRMFGTLLTWMQEHTAPVFLIATANDISALPPELLRKGRFDETFFVDLPGDAARKRIFEIHLKRRTLDPARYDLAALARASEGFSGAEIEQAVLASIHRALGGGTKPSQATLLECVAASPPLSVTMRESVANLRRWAQGRCMMAE